MKTALLRTVSHDLRTPLASIKASVSGLRQPGADYSEEDRAELLAAIEEEADRLTRLVSDLLDASRLEAGAMVPDRRPHDLAELIDTVVRRLQPRLGDRPLEIEIPETLPAVAYDYTQIDRDHHQPARKRHRPHAARQPAGDPRLDRPATRSASRSPITGPGVPPEDRERLFRPFERGRTRRAWQRPRAGHCARLRRGARRPNLDRGGPARRRPLRLHAAAARRRAPDCGR